MAIKQKFSIVKERKAEEHIICELDLKKMIREEKMEPRVCVYAYSFVDSVLLSSSSLLINAEGVMRVGWWAPSSSWLRGGKNKLCHHLRVLYKL